MDWGPVTGEPASVKTPAGAPVRLTPMQVPKASDVLASDLRERILSGEFPEGTSLPPERPISHSIRASAIGRSRARNRSFSAPTRWATRRLNRRTCSTMAASIR